MLTAAQLAEWQEFYDLEPWGGRADDTRHGILAATVAAASGTVTAPQTYMIGTPPPEVEPDVVADAIALFGGKPPGQSTG